MTAPQKIWNTQTILETKSGEGKMTNNPKRDAVQKLENRIA